ncbi:hypothetical protein AAMO2058_001322600 [Amorphochlora amoebiformis]
MADSTNAHFGPIPIQLVASQLGIEGLDEETAEELAIQVEYRIKQIVQLGRKFMKHSKREELCSEDVDGALRLFNVESLYGYSSSDPITFEKAKGYDDLFFVKDQIVSFHSILEEALPKCPPEPTFSVHWLAVEGQQPNVPQNPSFESGLDDVSDGEGFEQDKQPEPQESDKQVVKQIVKHVLSKEQQMYYERVTDAIKGSDKALHRAILKSLRKDPGLHQLLPYLVQFIADEVVHNLRNTRLLLSLMQMADALVHSSHLRIEPYLHQLMPAIMTCILGNHLCEKTSENHWALREYAAGLVAQVCSTYGAIYPNLQPRVINQLNNAFLHPLKPLTTHYGAVVALKALGDKVVEATLLKHCSTYLKLLHPLLDLATSNTHKTPKMSVVSAESKRRNLQKVVEATRVYGALLDAVGGVVRQHVYAIDYARLLQEARRKLARIKSRKKMERHANPENRSQSSHTSLEWMRGTSTGQARKRPMLSPSLSTSTDHREKKQKREAQPRQPVASSSHNGLDFGPRAVPGDGPESAGARSRGAGAEVTAGSGASSGDGNDAKGEGHINGKLLDEGSRGRSISGVKENNMMRWEHLYGLFGEQILPYSKVHLRSDRTGEQGKALPSLGDLFL